MIGTAQAKRDTVWWEDGKITYRLRHEVALYAAAVLP
jgi:hypothetical protein